MAYKDEPQIGQGKGEEDMSANSSVGDHGQGDKDLIQIDYIDVEDQDQVSINAVDGREQGGHTLQSSSEDEYLDAAERQEQRERLKHQAKSMPHLPDNKHLKIKENDLTTIRQLDAKTENTDGT